MIAKQLAATANELVTKGKGILAADESGGTIKNRFDSIGVESTEDNRRAYRELLFRTPGMEEFISGVILYDETIRQSAADGTPLPQLLSDKGVIPGIKSDAGAKDLAGFPGEKVTEGLDGLRDRFADWRKLGARFSKWRAVIQIGDGLPSRCCIEANATLWRGMRPSLRKRASFPSWNRRCSWMVPTISIAARRLPSTRSSSCIRNSTSTASPLREPC